jgi:CRISPR type III-A-associated protein Csm2
MSLKFYTDSNRNIVRPELFDKEAREWAKKLLDGKNGVSHSQFRKLYEEIIRLNKLSQKKSWNSIIPLVKLVKSKVAYATAKIKNTHTRRAYDELNNLFKYGIDEVNTQEDLNILKLFLEAVYGYYYEFGGSKVK